MDEILASRTGYLLEIFLSPLLYMDTPLRAIAAAINFWHGKMYPLLPYINRNLEISRFLIR